MIDRGIGIAGIALGLIFGVLQYYVLGSAVVGVGPNGDGVPVAVFTTLVVSFEPEVRITTLKARSPVVSLPHHEVKEFNQGFAVIFFVSRLIGAVSRFEIINHRLSTRGVARCSERPSSKP